VQQQVKIILPPLKISWLRCGLYQLSVYAFDVCYNTHWLDGNCIYIYCTYG